MKTAVTIGISALAAAALVSAAPASADNYGPAADAKFFAAMGIRDPSRLPADTREMMESDGHKVCSLQRMGMDNATIQRALSQVMGGNSDSDTYAAKVLAAANMSYCQPNGQ